MIGTGFLGRLTGVDTAFSIIAKPCGALAYNEGARAGLRWAGNATPTSLDRGWSCPRERAAPSAQSEGQTLCDVQLPEETGR